MTPEAALDRFASSVALRLAGPDARRRLHLALARHPQTAAEVDRGIAQRLERLEALVTGVLRPDTLQDRIDLHAAEAARTRPPFPPDFWMLAVADLRRAGFDPLRAQEVVADVRGRVEPHALVKAEEEQGA